ncbi:hypothetical protein [Pontibacillus yanchengensis]|uniref:Uncharacterized protein n=1 Tax=Pontibacillus yanchengensis Y32 TaxID=1385514 RepID=A0A0A2T549_9BACI|nr:hypothetical protein [Pontibacillus yanchengensis]KGP70877.1 hypothetical protein N782_03635 [Pontibacillus yanchengensis Y32]
MSNAIEQHNEDQAHGLRQLTMEQQASEEEAQDIDVLNLPPRSSIHNEKSTKTKWKLQYPLIRLLMVLLVLIVLSIVIFRLWNNLNIGPVNQGQMDTSFAFFGARLK